jgi:hypothetical protein
MVGTKQMLESIKISHDSNQADFYYPPVLFIFFIGIFSRIQIAFSTLSKLINSKGKKTKNKTHQSIFISLCVSWKSLECHLKSPRARERKWRTIKLN